MRESRLGGQIKSVVDIAPPRSCHEYETARLQALCSPVKSCGHELATKTWEGRSVRSSVQVLDALELRIKA